jgi:cytochrome c-type biogenesis protein CcmH
MTLWLILTIMTSIAAVMLSAPFIRRIDRPQPETAGSIEVYRDQLKEVEVELRQGLIDEAQAESARVEIKRRALAADRIDKPVRPEFSGQERSFAAIGVTGIVVLGSVGLYAVTGSPDLPSMQGTASVQRATATFGREPSILERLSAAAQTPASEGRGSRPQAGLPPVDEMIQRLATRLLQNPKDVEGWRTLGWSYSSIGQYADAAEAYAKAIELNPDVADIRTARIEALVNSAGGVIATDTKDAIEDTLKINPRNARALFFKGLAKEQAGDKAAALTDWIQVLKDANSDEPWVPDLKNKITALERDLGFDAGMRATAQPTAGGELLERLRVPGAWQTSPVIEKGPSPQDVQTAEAMPAAERAEMIRSMVDGLANRLEQSPRDADGWIKLIRSRVVLGDSDQAKQALARALEVFTQEPQQRDRIAAAARQLGLNQ